MRGREEQIFYYDDPSEYNAQFEAWQKQNPSFRVIEVLQGDSDQAEGPFKRRFKGAVTYANDFNPGRER